MNYLTKYVSIDGCSSSEREIVCGVPQGTVLGPLLFLIYINDLFFTNLFADDTSFLKTSSNMETLIKETNKE